VGVPIGLQRLGLAPAAIEREHELCPRALAKRLAGDQPLELADDLSVAPALEVGLDPVLEHPEAKVLQARDLALGEVRVGDLGQRRAPP
jgi:hypothetical protein